jgi:iron complex transport system permease protein
MIRSNAGKSAVLLLGLLILILSILSSILFGLTHISWRMVIDAYTHFDGSNEHLVIQTARVPRALIATAVGASLAVAGALMQAITRNPLASPDILGVNSGAGFFVVLAVTLFSISSLKTISWLAFLGAGVTALIVYFLSSLGREGLTPIKLTLAGAALAALFSSFTQGVLLLKEKAIEEVIYWLAGSVEGRKLEYLASVFPYIVIGLILAFMLAKHINILAMGEDMAKGLGQRTGVVKFFALLVIVFLAGSSVAVAGPISFIGLIVPHIVRSIVGSDHRWIIPYSAVLGGILLLLADIGARFVIMPKEVPVGAMTALIGTPFFVYLARRGYKG